MKYNIDDQVTMTMSLYVYDMFLINAAQNDLEIFFPYLCEARIDADIKMF